jgi:hypothetical protein
MPFPTTAKGFIEQGYTKKNTGTCRGCGADLIWYLTPKGKAMPVETLTLEPHWAKCPNAEDFRKKKP